MNGKEFDHRIRLKSTWILLLGLLCAVVSLFVFGTSFSTDQKIFTFLFTVGTSIMTIGVITFIWDVLGGDPITNTLKWFRKLLILQELGFENLLIRNIRIGETYISDLHQKIRSAKKVHMMGLVLMRDWFSDKLFTEICFAVLNGERECEFKILLLKPYGLSEGSQDDKEKLKSSNEILFQRAKDESFGDEKVDEFAHAKRMNVDICSTLKKLDYLIGRIETPLKKGRIEVRVADKCYLTCSVIRVDDQILAIHYLHKTGGDNTPAIQIKSENSALFKIYEKEFYTVWENSSEGTFESNCIEDS